MSAFRFSHWTSPLWIATLSASDMNDRGCWHIGWRCIERNQLVQQSERRFCVDSPVGNAIVRVAVISLDKAIVRIGGYREKSSCLSSWIQQVIYISSSAQQLPQILVNAVG